MGGSCGNPPEVGEAEAVTDDAIKLELLRTPRPPIAGPGATRSAWIEYARAVEEANANLQDVIARLDHERRELIGRVTLKRTVAGRAPMPAKTDALIEEALATGASSRKIAAKFGVSHTHVNRVRQRQATRRGRQGGT